MAYSLHPIYDMRVGLERDRVRHLLGKPLQIRPVVPGREMWLYAGSPEGHLVAVTFTAGRLDYMELRADLDTEQFTVLNLGELGFSAAMSLYAVYATMSLLQELGPVDEETVLDLRSRAKGVVSIRTEPVGKALKHLTGILDRGIELPGVRAHLVNPRADRSGVEVLTLIGADAASVRDDRISHVWLLRDGRIAVMEVRV